MENISIHAIGQKRPEGFGHIEGKCKVDNPQNFQEDKHAYYYDSQQNKKT